MSLETLAGSHVVPDFSYAGYQNGLGELPKATGTIIEVADFGALPDDAVDDSAAIQRAIDAANAVAGPVIVRFAAGTYRVTSVLKITRSDFVLQGQGAGDRGTRLHFPRPLKHVDQSSSLDELRSYLRQLNKRQ
ncbi:MAG: glycosyl hydrolase family 28-related protein, partial [Luminiphilus sp.]|nr:glycosyl hydrolase family 28-related protein [Luminiphilus sp.]